MSLKKNDKIVAILGVAILVIAGIAIFLYPQDDTIGKPTEPVKKSFEVIWEQKTETTSYDTEYVTMGEPYSKSFTFGKNSGVLTSVSIRIEWEDDNTYGILKKHGQDTLTLNIGLAGGAVQNYEGTGSGNETLSFSSINVKPTVNTIEAENRDEADIELMNITRGKGSAEFNVEGTIVVGEGFKIFQPIRSLLNKDSGNDFSLYVTYTYWYPEIVEDTE